MFRKILIPTSFNINDKHNSYTLSSLSVLPARIIQPFYYNSFFFYSLHFSNSFQLCTLKIPKGVTIKIRLSRKYCTYWYKIQLYRASKWATPVYSCNGILRTKRSTILRYRVLFSQTNHSKRGPFSRNSIISTGPNPARGRELEHVSRPSPLSNGNAKSTGGKYVYRANLISVSHSICQCTAVRVVE